jgi:hypothetical protein
LLLQTLVLCGCDLHVVLVLVWLVEVECADTADAGKHMTSDLNPTLPAQAATCHIHTPIGH